MTFRERLLETLKRLFSSAKFLTTMGGVIVALAAKRGIILSPEDVNTVMVLFSVLIGAMGLNDLGKGAKQVEAANPTPQGDQVNIQNVNPAPEPLSEPVRITSPLPPQG